MLTQHEKRKTLVFMLYLSEFYDKDEIGDELKLFLDNDLFVEKEITEEKIPVMLPDELEAVKAELISEYGKIREKTGMIDPMIASVAQGWRLERMGRIDLQIMRVAVYEIFYNEAIPSAVAISEALILARAYGSDEGAPAFINGILGRIEKDRKKLEG